MRKLKRYKYLIKYKDYIFIYERIKNDIYGNPKYQIDVFKHVLHLGTYNIVSYDILSDITSMYENFNK